MKKIKWLKSLGVAAALAMPATTVLTTLTSCGRKLYTELVSEMKDSLIETFMDLSAKTHRDLWNEGEVFTYIKQHMASMGFKPSGYDKWSEVPEVVNQRAAELQEQGVAIDKFRGDYGNIWFDIPATSSYAQAPGIIIHAHMDSQMVFNGGHDMTTGSVFDKWKADAAEGGCTTIEYNQSDEILETKGNTMSMGGDGGIGIAVLLTIAKYHNKFNHGPIRLLFAAGESEAVSQQIQEAGNVTTVDYAAGYSFLERDQWYEGKAIGHDDTSYLAEGSTLPFGKVEEQQFKYIISAAGITKNTIMVSSAGIHECAINATAGDSEGFLKLTDMELPTVSGHYYTSNVIDWTETKPILSQTETKHCFHLKLTGLAGGTSSLYINSGFANALSMVMQILESGDETMQFISAESLPTSAYTISNECEVYFTSMYNKDLWKTKMDAYLSGFKKSYPNEDWKTIVSKGIVFEDITDSAKTTYKVALSKQQTRGIIKLLASDIPYGPRDWFDDSFKQVKTSINMGPLEIKIPTQPETIGANVPASFKLHIVERSASTNHLYIFYNMIHLMLDEELDPLLQNASTTWDEKLATHISNPVWEPPTSEEPNTLASAFSKAYSNFELKSTTSKEHGWVEIACTPAMFAEHQGTVAIKTPQMVLIGPDIIWNHSRFETIYSETIVSVIETIVYVLDHTPSLLK